MSAIAGHTQTTANATGTPYRAATPQVSSTHTAVPWRVSVKLARRLEADDVAVSLVKDADQRFLRPQDIARICDAIDELTGLLRPGP